MDEYLEMLYELGLTEEDNKDECLELAKALFRDEVLSTTELIMIQDRLEVQ